MWREGTFDGKAVWVEVAGGRPKVDGGRVAIRYSPAANAKIYRGGAGKVALTGEADLDLPAGVSADAAGKTAAKGGKGFGSAGKRSVAQAAAAASTARELIAGLDPGTILCYTDGGCVPNPGPGGSGCYVELPDGRRAEWALPLGPATNNIAELTAIRMALELLDEADVPPDAPVSVMTDSNYSHGVLVKNWKPKANVELIADIRARLKRRPGVSVRWIAGHVGVDGNERADRLANGAVSGVAVRRWS